MTRNLLLSLLLSVIIAPALRAQSQYEVVKDKDGSPIFKGILSREILEKEPSFSWYAQNQKPYTPYAAAIPALHTAADSVRLVVFMGTWCEDSHFIIPKLFVLLDAAGFPADHVSVIGVDREKKTIGNLSGALHITNVPTIIAFRNGKELGRVIEYGKNGMWDKELGEIVAQSN